MEHQETLRRLAIFDDALAQHASLVGFGAARTGVLDGKTTALLQLAVLISQDTSTACVGWATTRAVAAGATNEEITDALVAIAPIAGLGRIVSVAPDVADALDYDLAAALEEHDDS
ncbi:carboxymuconolactone decarboxylase family protein [Jatrophihabitans sp. DSM 45814]